MKDRFRPTELRFFFSTRLQIFKTLLANPRDLELEHLPMYPSH